MVRTQIQLTEAQARTIKKVAMEKGTSVAEVIRRAVENMVQSNPKISTQERIRRAIEIAGKFQSGKRNISRKHDEYLAEAYEK
ncbi:MAG: CopG family transcriptional regulator [Deltaproteobacteria bacterium RBG_19FT_COMBO_52_11]|jgi:metal-responsive CopG/Arc/MetJ family transcriptional regulator|nr:MAG: CopG family transcriptional regulator [Deltaproteobacteria bacterium RBG_19FT_COMBO_52_11]